MGFIDQLQSAGKDAIMWFMGGKAMDEYEEAHVERQRYLLDLLAYYNGDHRKPLKVTGLGHDYNVLPNFTKTIVDRSISMLLGEEPEFDLPGDEETEQDKLITDTWNANKKLILLMDLCQFGGIYGTQFIKIIPEARETLEGATVARLVALNPYNTTIFSDPEDYEKVLRYVFRWNVDDTAWREITALQESGIWLVWREKSDSTTRGAWQMEGEAVTWDYEFAPIVHGKNLPRAGNVYGMSDIEDIIDLQDKYNEAQSNINKILALQAFSQKYIIGGTWPRVKDDKGNEYIDAGPDKALEIKNPEAKVGILQPEADMSASRSFANDLRRDLFDLASTVDVETIKEKAGALTNFGLRVLYRTELAKNATKQRLYGEMLEDINHRLLVLSGRSGKDADPGMVVWGEPLPINETEETTSLQSDLNMGIVSKQTVALKRGYDWENEQERLADETQTSRNVGGNLIRDFLAGRGQQ